MKQQDRVASTVSTAHASVWMLFICTLASPAAAQPSVAGDWQAYGVVEHSTCEDVVVGATFRAVFSISGVGKDQKLVAFGLGEANRRALPSRLSDKKAKYISGSTDDLAYGVPSDGVRLERVGPNHLRGHRIIVPGTVFGLREVEGGLMYKTWAEDPCVVVERLTLTRRVDALRDAVKVGQVSSDGAVPADAVTSMVEERLGEMRGCLASALDKSPRIVGALKLVLTLNAYGRPVMIGHNEDTTGSPQLARCMVDVANEWRFPLPTGGAGSITVPLTINARAGK